MAPLRLVVLALLGFWRASAPKQQASFLPPSPLPYYHAPVWLRPAAQLILKGLAALAGADSTASGDTGAGGTGNPGTLFKSTNAVSLFFCTATKKAPTSPINAATLATFPLLAAAAGAGDAAALTAQYTALQGFLVLRFLQYSLEAARLASAPASVAVLNKAGDCRKTSLRVAQQVAGGKGRMGGRGARRCCCRARSCCNCNGDADPSPVQPHP